MITNNRYGKYFTQRERLAEHVYKTMYSRLVNKVGSYRADIEAAKTVRTCLDRRNKILSQKENN